MLPLVLGSLALFMGPLLEFAGAKRRWLRLFVTGFVVVAVGGIVLFHAIPEAWERLSWGALPLLVLGLAIPSLAERFVRAGKGRGVVAALAVALFLAHALVDGAVLGSGDAGLLALALVLHRVPEGIAIWWFVRGAFGRPIALLALGGAALAPFLGSMLFSQPSTALSAALQATVAGALLHVLLHHARVGHGRECEPIASHSQLRCSAPAAAGALLATVVLVASASAHAESPSHTDPTAHSAP